MLVVLVSNFLNHHQLPICQEFLKRNDVEFHFVATEQMEEERVSLGYEQMNSAYDFVIPAYLSKDNYELAIKKCNEADFVIFGSASFEYIKQRLKARKIVFFYSERLFKGTNVIKNIGRAIKWFTKIHVYGADNSKCFLLSAGTNASKDYNLLGLYRGRCFKWGYFPEVHELVDKPINSKLRILWVGRLIPWKHPEVVFFVADILNRYGVGYEILVVGTGGLSDSLKQRTISEKYADKIYMKGSMTPELVYKEMIKSDIFLFSSDSEEGWGAVVNEAMQCGDVVIARNCAGSVGYLIQDGMNGLIYFNEEELQEKVLYLLRKKYDIGKIQQAAITTLTLDWNASVAVERLIDIYECITAERTIPEYSGVLEHINV